MIKVAIELDIQIHNKKRIAIMSGIMIALSIYTLSDISNQSSPEPYTAKTSKTSTGTPINEPSDEATAAATNTSELQIVSINPFLELKEFDPTVQNISDMTNTSSYENSSTTGARPSNIPLPAIPHYNGHINYQERPQSIPAPAIKPEQPITVQGIGIGNSGNNIAILSDGRVVSEGDTYNDGRIAYIGGDGILFDNGEKLQYK